MEGKHWPLTKSLDVLLIFQGRSLPLGWQGWLCLQLFLQLQKLPRKDSLLEPWPSFALLRPWLGPLQRIGILARSTLFPQGSRDPLIPPRHRIRRHRDNLQQHRLLLLHAGPTQISPQLLQNCKRSDDLLIRRVPLALPDHPREREPMQQSLLRERTGVPQVMVGLREGHVRQEEEKEEERRQEEMIDGWMMEWIINNNEL